GTGSLRRKTQLLHARADLTIENIRGNVETRLAKLDAGQYDAVVLAEAGLRRLGLGARIGQILPASIMLPAVGQGALGIETRYADAITRKVVLAIDHPPTHAAVLAERALLAALEGGCSAPIAAWGHVEDQTLRLAGRVLRFDGTQKVDATREGKIDQPRQLGQLVAEQLNAQGAAELIQEARRR
ncbi:MAG: hydroxymethylbilane synthase, partial [Pirellulales bacterium]|nr:hydroxymethylbilane synthase [Pirellulales bacterium]